jgi:hypothetical protein
MNRWYTVKVKYNKKSEDGQEPKKANEAFLLPAVSFTDAEARINKEIGQTATGEFLVHAMSVTEITEIIRNNEGGQWYLGGITISDEDDNGKVSKTKQNYMIEAMSVKDATTNLEKELEDAMFEFETTKVAVSTIVDVLHADLDVEISRTSAEETA